MFLFENIMSLLRDITFLATVQSVIVQKLHGAKNMSLRCITCNPAFRYKSCLVLMKAKKWTALV